MQKSVIFLSIVGSLIGIGMVLSFYGSQIITENLDVKEETLTPGNSVEIITELNTEESKTGVFVVQVLNFKEQNIVVKVFDPFGNQIISETVDKESFEDRFEILSSGTYRLFIENLDFDDAQIVGVIGHMPDTSKLSIGITGFYILIVGIIGIVGVGIYAIKNRRKEKLS